MNNPVAWCLAYLFNKYLSGFLKELNTEQVLVSTFRGDIRFADLKINPKRFKHSGIDLCNGTIKAFRLSIPWSKVLLGENCVIKLEITNVALEFKMLSGAEEGVEDSEGLKQELLQKFEEKIMSRRSSFAKILTIMSSKMINVETVEFILSRLEVEIKGVNVVFKGDDGSSLIEAGFDLLKISPTDNEFKPFPEENYTLWEKIQSIGTLAAQKSLVSLSDSLLQFKIIDIKGFFFGVRKLVSAKIIEIRSVEAFYSGKNYLWMGQSEKDTDIHIQVTVNEISVNAENDLIKGVINVLTPHEKKFPKSGKLLWAKARELILKRVRMKSWLYITRKILWKSIYKKLYSKHVLGMDPEPSNFTNTPAPAQTNKLNQYIQLFIPAIEAPSNKKKIESSIIPALHFSANCPIEKLELALMADLERNLDIADIIQYRQEEQDRFDYEQFEKNMKKGDFTGQGCGKINNYFKAKGKIMIQKNENSKIVNLELIATVNKIEATFKSKIGFHNVFYIYNTTIEEICVFTEPLLRYKQINYDRNSSTKIKAQTIEVFDLWVKDSRMLKPICSFTSGAVIVIADNLRNEYDSGFKETLTKRITMSIPDLKLMIVPELMKGVNDYIYQLFPHIYTSHDKEDELMELLEPIQDVKIYFKHESPLIISLNIRKLEAVVATSYNKKASAIKALIGGLGIKRHSNKTQADIEYLELTAMSLIKYLEVSNYFIPVNLISQSISITSFDNSTHVIFPMIQSEISSEQIFCVTQLANEWSKLISYSEKEKQIINVSLKCKWIEHVLQKLITSYVVNVNEVFINISIDNQPIYLIISHVVASGVGYFFEDYKCISAREVTVINSNTGQILLHIYQNSEVPDNIIQAPPTLYKDSSAAFYFINECIDRMSNKYRNMLSNSEFTFSNFHIGIDLKIIRWILKQTQKMETVSVEAVPHSTLIIASKMIAHGSSFSVLFLNECEPNYMLLARKAYVIVDNYSNKMQVRARLIEPNLIDNSVESSVHSNIFKALSEDSCLDLNYIARSSLKNETYEKTTEIRLTNSKLTFLNRVILELYHYTSNELMSIFASDLPTTPSTSNISFLIQNSQFFIPRNSAVADGFTLEFSSFEFSNAADSFLLKNHKFKFETEFAQKLNQLSSAASLDLVSTHTQWKSKTKRTQLRTNDSVENFFEKDPMSLKAQVLIEKDGLEIYYYDPDEVLLESNSTLKRIPEYRSSNLSQINESSAIYEDDPGPEILYTERNSDSSSPSFDPRKKSKKETKFEIITGNFDRDDSLSGSSSENETSFKTSHNTNYTIWLKGCQILDFSEEPISSQSFDLFISIDPTETPMNIKIDNNTNEFNLNLYQDQYYIMMKTMQENFMELSKYSSTDTSSSEVVWLKLELCLSNVALTLMNGSLSYAKANDINYLGFRNHTEFCQIFLDEFNVRVSMKENGNKSIKIDSSNFRIQDIRYESAFNFEDLPPAMYMYSPKAVHRHKLSSVSGSMLDSLVSPKVKNSSKFMPPIQLEEIQNNLSIKIKMQNGKNIMITFSHTIFFVLPDFLSDLQFYFQAPFNEELFQDPENIKFIPDPNPPDMTVVVDLSHLNLIFLSSYESIEAIAMILRFQNLNLKVMWKGDSNIGPGTLEVALTLNLEAANLAPVKYGLEFSDNHYYDRLIEPYILNIDYLFHKPDTDSNWVTSQVNIRSTKDKDFNLNLSFSGISSLKQIFNNLSLSPCSNPYRSLSVYSSQVPLDAPNHLNQLSVNLALYGANCKIFNDQMQPVFQASIRESLSAFQQESSIKDCEAIFIILMEVGYFNQKLMAWEPLIEQWGLVVEFSRTNGISSILVREYNNNLQINITAAFITTLSNIWPILMNLTDSKAIQQVSLEPYVFENQTGLPIRIYIKQSQWSGQIEQDIDEDGKFTLKLEDLNKMNKESQKRQRALIYDKKTLTIEFRQKLFLPLKFKAIQNICIDTPDTYFIDLEVLGERHQVHSSTRKKPIELIGRISRHFIDEREFQQHIEKHGYEKNTCFSCLSSKKKYHHRLHKAKPDNSEKESHNKICCIVDVQWKPESNQRVVTMRSSISIVNSLPTNLIITFIRTDNIEDSIDEVSVAPNAKLPVPILVVKKGRICLRPTDDYERSSVIRRVNGDVYTKESLIISPTEGIVDKNLLTVVEYYSKGNIELGFIPLYCRSHFGPFYCALTVKKIVSANPVRRIEQVVSSSLSKKDLLIGYKKKKSQAIKEYSEDHHSEEEEFHLETTSDEIMLVITSIMSFTNSLPRKCKLKVWTDDEPSEYSELSQGETEHLYSVHFYKDKVFISVSIEGYKFCSPIEICPLNINKEQKSCIEMIKDSESNNPSQLFLRLQAIEDENRCWRFTLFSPYWIINKTDLNLRYGEPRMFRKKKFSNEDSSEPLGSKQINIYDNSPGISHDIIDDGSLFSSKVRKKSSKRSTIKFTLEDYKKFSVLLQGAKANPELAKRHEKGWKQITLFSTSKIITKLNVAVNIQEKLSKWSQNFSLTNSGTSGELHIEGSDGIQYDLGVTIEKGLEVFQLTNIITFRPLYILKNNYSRELTVKQIDVDKRKASWTLHPNSELPLYWHISKSEKALSVAVNLGQGHELTKKWSGAFRINELGEFIIRLPIDHIDGRAEDIFLQVSVISSDPMIIIQFSESTYQSPYRLENYTPHEIQFNQIINARSQTQSKVRTLKPGNGNEPTIEKYAWDEEKSPHVLTICIGKAKKDINFDDLAKYSAIKIDEEKWKEVVMKNKMKEGRLYLKMKKWKKSQYLTVTLTEKWLIIQNKVNPISLEMDCTKLIYINDKSFELTTCTKSIIFTHNNEEDCFDWYKVIDESIRRPVVSTQLNVNVSVDLSGGTHVMKFESEDALKTEKHHPKCKKAKKECEALDDNENIQTTFRFNIVISEIGFSLIDQTPQERIYIFLQGFDVMFQRYENQSFGVHFSVTELKIDNQQATSSIPVILNPYFNSKSSNIQDKTIMFDIIASRLPELDNINWLRFMIAPLEIKLDESIISNMMDYFTFVQKAFQFLDTTDAEKIETPSEDAIGQCLQRFSADINAFLMLKLALAPLISDQNKDLAIERRIYIEKLVLGPLELCVTLDKDNFEESRNKKTNFIQILADLGLALTSIESTELRLAGYKISKLLQPRSQFVNSMFNHYKSQGIRELYKIVGSVELLGNPFALINSLKAGVKEMFYDPAVALIESPNKFGESLLKGSVGLVRHTVHGLFKSVGTLTGGIGRFLTALTLDKKFQTKMRFLKARRANNFGDKLKIGFKQISYGFVQGITGLVTSPIEGIKEGGLPGLLKGIGKGIIGTVAKPTAGIVGTVSDAFSGIGNFAKKKHNVRNNDRSRCPRSFNSDKILRPYDKLSSKGQFFLAKFKDAIIYEKIQLCSKIKYKKRLRFLIYTNKSLYLIKRNDYRGIEIPRKIIEGSPVIENHMIVVTVNLKNNSENENDVSTYKTGHKKRLLKDLYVKFEVTNKDLGTGTFQISLRGILENIENEVSQFLVSLRR